MSKRMDVTWLGRTLGTASGWDGDPGDCWWVYDFQSLPGDPMQVTCSCLQFNETEGTIEAQDNEGNAMQTWQIDWTLREVPNA